MAAPIPLDAWGLRGGSESAKLEAVRLQDASAMKCPRCGFDPRISPERVKAELDFLEQATKACHDRDPADLPMDTVPPEREPEMPPGMA